jgi:hypothetical protein
MHIKKENLYTVAAAFGIVRNAVKQVTKCTSESTDKIIFNSLNKVMARKAAQKEAK